MAMQPTVNSTPWRALKKTLWVAAALAFRLPLAVQVHHGVCDGFHVCRFVNELQELLGQREIFRP